MRLLSLPWFNYKISLCLMFGMLAAGSGVAQITFPNGNTLNLNTDQEYVYLETRILFNTGIYKANDYRWEKITDSLDQRWFVTACFNGDCRNDLLQSGQFKTDYGINDTTCFIAFHVESKGITGTSFIKYKILNTKNQNDTATLTYRLHYYNTSAGLSDLQNTSQLQVKYLVAGCEAFIYNQTTSKTIVNICSLTGEIVDTFSLGAKSETHLNTANLAKGIYLIKSDIGNAKLIVY